MLTQNKLIEPNSGMLAVVKEFHAVSPSELAVIAKALRWRHYSAGEVIVRCDDDTNNIFFIVQGEIRVTHYSLSGHEVILCDLPAGEMFGELTAIDDDIRSATVIAKMDSLLASMSAAVFLSLIHSNEQVSLAILKRLTGQIRRLTQRVFDFSTLPVRNRIYAELLRLAKSQTTAPNTAVLSPAPTHTDLASLVSTHREAVTRELNYLVRNNLIKRRNRDLIILDMAKLTQMVDEVRSVSKSLFKICSEQTGFKASKRCVTTHGASVKEARSIRF